MNDTSTADSTPPKTFRDHATDTLEVMERVMDGFFRVFEEQPEGKEQPSLHVSALLSDTQALLEGIRDGVITTGQPRLVTNLVAAVKELDEAGYGGLAMNGISLIKLISVHGLSAENSSLGRRQDPQAIRSHRT